MIPVQHVDLLPSDADGQSPAWCQVQTVHVDDSGTQIRVVVTAPDAATGLFDLTRVQGPQHMLKAATRAAMSRKAGAGYDRALAQGMLQPDGSIAPLEVLGAMPTGVFAVEFLFRGF